jgi:hypothetical protein
LNSLVNEQVAVGLHAAYGDEASVRPNRPAVVRQVVDEHIVSAGAPRDADQKIRAVEAIQQGA